MSVSASIDIKFVQNKNEKISSVEIVRKLIQCGWTFNDHGLISYLPIGDNDEYNWRSEDVSIDYITNLLSKKEQNNENIGIVLTWKDTNIGGQFLLWNDGNISINLTINLKRINEIKNPKITDLNWYFTRLIPIFAREKLLIESYSYQENI